MNIEDQIGNTSNGMPTGTWRDHVEAQTRLMRDISSRTDWTVVLLLVICGLLIWIGLRLHP